VTTTEPQGNQAQDEIPAGSWWSYCVDPPDSSRPLQAVVQVQPAWKEAKESGRAEIGLFLEVFPRGGTASRPNLYLEQEAPELHRTLGGLLEDEFKVLRDNKRFKRLGSLEES